MCPCSNTPDSNDQLVIRLQQSLITSWSFETGTHLNNAGSPRTQDREILMSPVSDYQNALSYEIASLLTSHDFANELNERELILCFMIRNSPCINKAWLWRSKERCPLLFSAMAGLYSSMTCSLTEQNGSCYSDYYGCDPTFDHNVGCNVRVVLSVFLLIDFTGRGR